MTLGSQRLVCLPSYDARSCFSGGTFKTPPPSLPPAPTPPQAVNVTFEAVLGISRVDLRVAQKGWSVVRGP